KRKNKMVKNYFSLIILFSFFLYGCSSQKEVIRDKKVSIAVPKLDVELKEINPVTIDSLLVVMIDSLASDSSYYETEEVTPRGDTIKARFFLKAKDINKPKLELEVIQPPVDTIFADTTHIVKERETLG